MLVIIEQLFRDIRISRIHSECTIFRTRPKSKHIKVENAEYIHILTSAFLYKRIASDHPSFLTIERNVKYATFKLILTQDASTFQNACCSRSVVVSARAVRVVVVGGDDDIFIWKFRSELHCYDIACFESVGPADSRSVIMNVSIQTYFFKSVKEIILCNESFRFSRISNILLHPGNGVI